MLFIVQKYLIQKKTRVVKCLYLEILNKRTNGNRQKWELKIIFFFIYIYIRTLNSTLTFIGLDQIILSKFIIIILTAGEL